MTMTIIYSNSAGHEWGGGGGGGVLLDISIELQ